MDTPWRLSGFSQAMILPFEIKEGAISEGPEITAGRHGSGEGNSFYQKVMHVIEMMLLKCNRKAY